MLNFRNLRGGMEIHDVYIMGRLKRIVSLENQVDGFSNFNVEKECLTVPKRRWGRVATRELCGRSDDLGSGFVTFQRNRRGW